MGAGPPNNLLCHASSCLWFLLGNRGNAPHHAHTHTHTIVTHSRPCTPVPRTCATFLIAGGAPPCSRYARGAQGWMHARPGEPHACIHASTPAPAHACTCVCRRILGSNTVSFSSLSKSLEEIDSSVSQAETAYRVVLELYNNSPRLVRVAAGVLRGWRAGGGGGGGVQRGGGRLADGCCGAAGGGKARTWLWR